jgi:hypothetical protein
MGFDFGEFFISLPMKDQPLLPEHFRSIQGQFCLSIGVDYPAVKRLLHDTGVSGATGFHRASVNGKPEGTWAFGAAGRADFPINQRARQVEGR